MKKKSATPQSGVIPYRIIDGKVEILIITTRSGKFWTVPKGNIKKGLSVSESATEEAFEEAGISGRLIKPNIGSYNYKKPGGRYRVKLFLCEVTALAASFPEDHFRTRRWETPKKAGRLLKIKGLVKVLKKAAKKIDSLM